MKQVTVVRVDNGQPFIASATLVKNDDGSVSFQLADGSFAGQDPTGYGIRADGPATQQYQRGSLNGNSVTFFPLAGYPPYTYLVGFGEIFPA
jgi:hypothetical protein